MQTKKIISSTFTKNKPTIKEVVVVEGKSDTNHLKRLFNVDTIETNGSAINNRTISLIKKVATNRGIILFLDPDYQGELIRKKIISHLDNYFEAFVTRKKDIKKNGVCEASDEEIINAFKNIKKNNSVKNTLSLEEYQHFNLNSYEIRKKICDLLNIGYCNNKQMLKRFNMLGMNKNDINNLLKKINKK